MPAPPFLFKTTPSVKKFVGDVAAQCATHGISFRLFRSRNLRSESILYTGSFDGKSIQVATGNDRAPWLETLVHESCHLDQSIANTRAYRELGDSIDKIETWLKNPKATSRGIKSAFLKVIRMELECERMSVAKIIKYGLPLDIERYIQRANSYLIFHHVVLNTRKWENSKKEDMKWPYMPTKFLSPKNYMSPPKSLLAPFDSKAKKRVS